MDSFLPELKDLLYIHTPDICEVKVGDWFWIGSTETKLQINRSYVLLTIGKLQLLLFGWYNV